MKFSCARAIFFTLKQCGKSSKGVKTVMKTEIKQRASASWDDETEFLFGPKVKKSFFKVVKKSPENNNGQTNYSGVLSNKNKAIKVVSQVPELKINSKKDLNVTASVKEKKIRSVKNPEEETKYQNASSKNKLTNSELNNDLKNVQHDVVSISISEDATETDLYDYQEATPKELELILTGKFPLTYPAFLEGHKLRNQKINGVNSNNKEINLDKILKMPLFNGVLPVTNKILWKNLSLPSVSLILKSTMSPENIYILEEWEKKMIAQMGISEFELYKKALFENGSRLHSCIKSFLEGQMNVNISPSIEGYWNSVQHVLEEIEDTIALELPVQNTNLNYKGILDGVFVYKKKLCLVEWKTSKRLKSSLDKTFDNPLQLVAYLAAFNQQLFHPDFAKYKQKIEKFNLQTAFIENCLLVITYEDGTKADVHHMNREICNKYWEDWLQRLHKYWLAVS